jgi:SHS2 domain-containing protein
MIVPYEYIDDIAISDVAFHAWSDSLEGLFADAADAVINTMVEDPGTLRDAVHRPIRLEAESVEMLLFQFLQEFIFYKDAEQELLRPADMKISGKDEEYILNCEVRGEKMDPERHNLLVDVKAVTFHRFSVKAVSRGWEATVVLDT